MKRIISKLFLTVLLTALACSSAFAAAAKVTYVKGKVEVSRGNAWVTVKVGDEIKESETISTGFQSEARLNYNGSVMAVPALSRVTLETLQSSDTKETVSLKVDTGAVRSKVTHTEGKRIEYTARTSVAVASVRGTDFAVFANGKARVFEGAIAFFKAMGYIPPAPAAEASAGDAEGGAAGDEGSATATTPASEISGTAPKGSTVVGAGQTSKINKYGTASKPFTEAKLRTAKAKKAVASAAKKDEMNVSIGSSSGGDSEGSSAQKQEEKKPSEPVVKKGKVTVKVTVKKNSATGDGKTEHGSPEVTAEDQD